MAIELAKAYVQIEPSARGITGSISKVLGGEASSAGKSAGLDIAGAIKGAIAAAGIGAVVKESLDAGGALQQSFGGLDTLYGDAAQAAKDYAYQAAAAGISANNYAEQAVSFGAALKASLGDEAAAADAANTAILDMADNSAKMGTSIDSIQMAYQGFAKQNYTMLDNLKLGYGGTKTEMERLLADAESLTGVKYDINNLSDVYSAIHVIQGELGLTGTAAAEASTTFEGSFGAMKAAATNFMADLALGNNVTNDLQVLIGNTAAFLQNNLLPMLMNIVKAIPPLLVTSIQSLIGIVQEQAPNIIQALQTAFTETIPALLTQAQQLMQTIGTAITESLPDMLSRGVEIVTNIANGILENIPAVITAISNIVSGLQGFIMQNYPVIMAKGWELIQNLAAGIINNLPAIISAAVEAIAKFAYTVTSNLPAILEQGIKILAELALGIITAIPKLVAAVPEIFNNIKNALGSFDWAGLGLDIITGIKNGIVGAAGIIRDAALNAARSAFNSVKEFFQIGSPSKLMADEIGKFLPAGVAIGIEDNMSPLTSAMSDMTATASGYGGSVATAAGRRYAATVTSGTGDTLSRILNMLDSYLPTMGQNSIVLDTGVLVGSTVSAYDAALGNRQKTRGRTR